MRSYFADFVLKFSESIVNNSIVVAVELFMSDNCNRRSGSFLSLPRDKAWNTGANSLYQSWVLDNSWLHVVLLLSSKDNRLQAASITDKILADSGCI